MEVIYHEGSIREYDIRAANISCLTERGYIDEELFYDLLDGDKLTRNKIVGNLKWKHADVHDIIAEDIAMYVQKFIDANKLQENNILEIAKDAIFTNNIKDTHAKKLKLKFGEYIKFVPKNNYLTCFEFTIKKHSSIFLKLYLEFEGNAVTSRYGKLNKNSKLYGFIIDMIRCKFNGKTKRYNTMLREFIKIIKVKKLDDVCSVCSNERLIEAFRELATI